MISTLVILLAITTVVFGYHPGTMPKRVIDKLHLPIRTRPYNNYIKPKYNIEFPPPGGGFLPPKGLRSDIEWPPDSHWGPGGYPGGADQAHGYPRDADVFEHRYPTRPPRVPYKRGIYPRCPRVGAWCKWEDPEDENVIYYMRDKVKRALASGGKHQIITGIMLAYRKKSGHGFNIVMTYKQPPLDGLLFSCVIAFYEDAQGKEHLFPESFYCDTGYRKTNSRLYKWVEWGKPIPGQPTARGV